MQTDKQDKQAIWARYHQFMSALKSIDKDIYKIVKAQGTRYLPAVSIEDYGKISYGVGAKKYSNKYRMKTTFGRFIGRRLKKEVEPNLLGLVARKLAQTLQHDLGSFASIIEGSEIVEWYLDSGISSCMTSSRSYLALYEDNPDKVKMVKYDTEFEKARALLWVDVQSSKGPVILLDRIYSTRGSNEDTQGAGSIKQTAKDYASNLGMELIIRADHHRGYPNESHGVTDRRLTVSDMDISDEYPYLDTFYSTDDSGNFADYPEYEFRAVRTDGSLEGRCCCHNCGRSMDEENSYSDPNGDEQYCEYCYDELFYSCEACGEMFDRDDIRCTDSSECLCEQCYSDRYITCDHCGCEADRDKSQSVNGYEYCDDCFSEKYVYCDSCDEPVKREDMIEHGRESYCQSCFDDNFVKCSDCGEVMELGEEFTLDGENFCSDCADDKKEEETSSTVENTGVQA